MRYPTYVQIGRGQPCGHQRRHGAFRVRKPSKRTWAAMAGQPSDAGHKRRGHGHRGTSAAIETYSSVVVVVFGGPRIRGSLNTQRRVLELGHLTTNAADEPIQRTRRASATRPSFPSLLHPKGRRRIPKPTKSRHGRSSPQKAPSARLLMPVFITMQNPRPHPHGIECARSNATGKPNAGTKAC